MGEFQAVLKLAELPPGSMRTCILDGREIVLCHTREGVFARYLPARPGESAELASGRVNGVSPGFVDTPWWNGMAEDDRRAYFARATEQLPTRRIATAEDVADAVVLAATNRNLTRTVIETDGGARLVSLG